MVIPRTLVTTSTAEAREFLESSEDRTFVRKLLVPSAAHCPPTRLVTEEDTERLDAVRFSPVILQEYISGVDVRVTVVGDELFAAEIDARRTQSPYDFRSVFDQCRVAATGLESDDRRRILHLMRRLGLVYGALDFRRGDDGRLNFLEINPAGQWLFVEQRTGQPIAAALARELCRGARSVSGCGRKPNSRNGCDTATSGNIWVRRGGTQSPN